jgi:hypothetical protein
MATGTTPGYTFGRRTYRCKAGGGLGWECRGSATLCKLYAHQPSSDRDRLGYHVLRPIAGPSEEPGWDGLRSWPAASCAVQVCSFISFSAVSIRTSSI